MRDAIIHINGWPGTGKLTIARTMASQIGARVLDNHTMINPAETLFDRSDPLNQSLRKAVKAAIFEHVLLLKRGVPLILTDALADDISDSALFDEYRPLAAQRGVLLLSIVLDCAPHQNSERLIAPGRAERHKLTNPAVLASLRAKYQLLRPVGVSLIELDVSELTAVEAAAILIERCREMLESNSQPTEPSP